MGAFKADIARGPLRVRLESIRGRRLAAPSSAPSVKEGATRRGAPAHWRLASDKIQFYSAIAAIGPHG
jgi:hypothetical protein